MLSNLPPGSLARRGGRIEVSAVVLISEPKRDVTDARCKRAMRVRAG
ncbi:MAG: hypothetical protein JWR86_2745 [Enterovirga sp.]|jgi:hypothetical protein|nr:hypothetical protein [Enterovirga sp.]